jgi:hypothetical protein
MYSPSRTSINPGVELEFEGMKIYCRSAVEGLSQLREKFGMVPEMEQKFLELLAGLIPVLVDGGEKGLGISLSQVKAYLLALRSRWSSGAPLVELTTAQERAAICKKCPYHGGMPTGCYGCNGIASLMLATPPGVEDLGTCLKCGCVLNNKVWLSDEVLAADDRPIDFPSHCWVPS